MNCAAVGGAFTEDNGMLNYIWPIALVVLCNVVYQICAKSVPEGLNPFASLTVTYTVAAIACAAMFFAFSRGGNLFAEYKKVNFAPIVLGLVVVGLEVGFIFAYRAGWQVSKASLVQSTAVAAALLFVGYFAYSESLSWNKVVGALVCAAGLVLINIK